MAYITAHILWILFTILASQQVTRLDAANCQFESWDDYLSTWRNRYYDEAKKMYPFGESFCDVNATDQQKFIGFSPTISVPVYYHGVQYNSLWVGVDGAISFNETTTAAPIVYVHRNSWPNDNYPETPDPPFLAPFFSEADFNTFDPREVSELSYRVLDPTDLSKPVNEQNIAKGMLDHLSQEVRNSVVGANQFTASYGLVVTWYKVKFDGSSCESEDCPGNCPRNTYQLAMVLNGRHTYVIMNYYDIQWIGGAGSQLCDRCTGLKTSDSPNCKPAHIGFNAGYGRSFTALPYSYNVEKTPNIDKLSGSNVTGRFTYKVSGDRIIRGGCTNDTTLDNNLWPLETWPVHTNMMGGSSVEISAPCFHQNNLDKAKCKFGDQEQNVVPYSNTTLKARCVPPSLNIIGATIISLSTDGGLLFKYRDPMIINLLGRNPYKVHIDNPNNDWLNPTTLPITWNPADLGGSGVTIDIKLMGYREEGLPGETEGIWELLEITQTSMPNTGSYIVQTANVQCGNGESAREICIKYHVGAILVSVFRNDPNPPRTLSSEIIPLGWYQRTALAEEHGSDWVAYMCQQWIYEDDNFGGWQDDSLLPSCPCTLQQALVDWGRFLPDAHCDMYTPNEYGCKYYQGAVHCVLSTYSTPMQGSGSRCCYDNAGMLMYAGDSEYGSRSDRSHEWGLYPYEMPPRVPSLSHWVQDMAPWFYCCRWQDNKDHCYNQYMPRRKTPDCRYYEPHGFGFTFGDPHYTTLDGTTYTFNGHGEFWLLWAEDISLHNERVDLRVQARTTQPPPGEAGEVLATYTTAVTSYLGSHGSVDDNYIVTFIVDEFYEHSDNKLQVYVGNTMLEFDEHEARVQEFENFLVINNDPAEDKSATNFTLAYRLGVGLQVVFSHGLIQTILTIPEEFKVDQESSTMSTLGLLGMWNGNDTDDLRPRDWLYDSVDPDNSQDVHYQFGLSWMVREDESLFKATYRANMDYNYYSDETFTPIFSGGSEPTPNMSTLAEPNRHMLDVCGANEYCLYDYTVTQNEDIAQQTLYMQELADEIKVLSAKVLSCGHLDIRNSIKKEPFNYLAGSTVIIEGCREGYTLDGTKEYTCVDMGHGQAVWDPPISTRCVGQGPGLGVAAITGISVALGLVVFFLVLGLLICVLYLHKQRKKGKPTKPADMDSNIIDTSLTDFLPPSTLKTGGKARPQIDRSFVDEMDTSIDKHGQKPSNYDSDYTNDALQKRKGSSSSIENNQFVYGKNSAQQKDDVNPYIDMKPSPERKSKAKKEKGVISKPSPSLSNRTHMSTASSRPEGYIPTGLTPPQAKKSYDYEYKPVKPPYQYPTTSTLKSNYSCGLDPPRRRPPYQYPNQKKSGLDADVVLPNKDNYRSQPRKPPYVYPPPNHSYS